MNKTFAWELLQERTQVENKKSANRKEITLPNVANFVLIFVSVETEKRFNKNARVH